MKFEELSIEGTRLIRPEPAGDIRGSFSRIFCIKEMSSAGLPTQTVQASLSFNQRRGTVRGMHFQWPPSSEGKFVRCIRGGILDVALDLRPESTTYLQQVAVRLDDRNRNAIYIPPGVAHGFQTLADATEVMYQMTDFHAPELAGGVRWDDPVFAIEWPIIQGIVISSRDAAYSDFDREAFERELAQRKT